LTNLAILAYFRVDTSSFFAGAAATLAFFIVFSEVIKLFFSIVINRSSNYGSTITRKKGAARLDGVAARNDVDSPFKYVPL